MRFLAPAGTAITAGDLWGLTASARGKAPLKELERLLSSHSGSEQCLPMSSGRAAMVLALECMKRASGGGRDIVVIPAYTCYSVLAAVQNAGLRAVLCDVDPQTLDLDLAQLRSMDMSRVLGIVTANLYGIPNNLSQIAALAQERRVFMLDDAAQALGATCDGRAAGSFGDVGLYSFDKGKNIATMQGGALVVRPGPLADELKRAWRQLPAAATSETLSLLVKFFAYAALLRPALYGLVQRLPGLGLGQTPYETEYPRARYSATLAGAAVSELHRLAQINAVRSGNAARILQLLSGNAAVTPVSVPSHVTPVYLRLPILATDPGSRQQMIQALVEAGIGATASYPQSLGDLAASGPLVVPGMSRMEGARQVARTIITLPTHAWCDAGAAARIAGVLQKFDPSRI